MLNNPSELKSFKLSVFLLIMLAIPIIGLGTGIGSHIYYENQFTQALQQAFTRAGKNPSLSTPVSLNQSCNNPKLKMYIAGACEEYTQINYLIFSSLIVAAATISLIGLIKIAAKTAKNNRNLLVTFFAPGIKLTLLCLFSLIITNGIIAAYSLYLLETILIQRIHLFIIAGLVLGAFIGATNMLIKGFSFSKKLQQNVLAHVIDPDKNPELSVFIKTLAIKIGAISPKNIIVGLEPNFYVTAANIVVLNENKRLTGETIYLSLALMRLLSTEELTGIIGHELGHFKESDTKYSLYFSPIYAGLYNAINALYERGQSENIGILPLLPALTILKFFCNCSPPP